MKKRAVIVISTDKGLCGALNTNLLREAAKLRQGHDGLCLRRQKGGAVRGAHQAPVGGGVHLQGRAAFCRGAQPFPSSRRTCFSKGEVDEVDVLFTNFINTLTQKPEVRTLVAHR